MTRKHITRTSSLGSAGKTVKDIRRATRKHYGTEEKIRIILEGLRGESSIAELCRKVSQCGFIIVYHIGMI